MPQGAYLADENNTIEILLPKRYLLPTLSIGDAVEVFVYHDNEGRLTATTLSPLAQVGETAYLKCVDITTIGAFLSLGIHKDLLIPYSEQLDKMIVGHSYPVHIYIDQISNKMVASAKLNKHVGNMLPTYQSGSKVQALIISKTDIGYKCVIDHIHWGIIYFSDIDHPLRVGGTYNAYVVRTRDDGKIDLSIRPIGIQRIEETANELYQLIINNGGQIALGDKSSAQDILLQTKMSKKLFKRAVGVLYKDGKVEPGDYLTKIK